MIFKIRLKKDNKKLGNQEKTIDFQTVNLLHTKILSTIKFHSRQWIPNNTPLNLNFLRGNWYKLVAI